MEPHEPKDSKSEVSLPLKDTVNLSTQSPAPSPTVEESKVASHPPSPSPEKENENSSKVMIDSHRSSNTSLDSTSKSESSHLEPPPGILINDRNTPDGQGGSKFPFPGLPGVGIACKIFA